MSLDHHSYPNGLNLYVDHMPGRQVTAVNVHLPYGSVHEAPGQEGLAHVLEHAVFTKTPKFKNLSAIELYGQLNGMTHNAATGYTNTTHETRGLSLGPAFIHLSEILQHSLLPKKAIAHEMQSVRREANDQLDDVDEMHDLACNYAMFDSPYGRASIGYRNGLFFDADTVRKAYETYYTLGSMAVIVVGGATLEQAAKELERYFDTTTLHTAYVPPAMPRSQPREGVATALRNEVISGSRLSISYPLPPELVADIQDNEELYDIAVSLMYDRSFESLRYKHGLVYGSEVQIADYNHANAWALRGTVTADHDSVDKVARIFGDEMATPAKNYSKKRIKGALAMGVFGAIGSLESIIARIEAHTNSVDVGRAPHDLDAVTDRIRSLTVKDVSDAVDKLAEVTSTQPRFEHRTGPAHVIKNADQHIKKSAFI